MRVLNVCFECVFCVYLLGIFLRCVLVCVMFWVYFRLFKFFTLVVLVELICMMACVRNDNVSVYAMVVESYAMHYLCANEPQT